MHIINLFKTKLTGTLLCVVLVTAANLTCGQDAAENLILSAINKMDKIPEEDRQTLLDDILEYLPPEKDHLASRKKRDVTMIKKDRLMSSLSAIDKADTSLLIYTFFECVARRNLECIVILSSLYGAGTLEGLVDIAAARALNFGSKTYASKTVILSSKYKPISRLVAPIALLIDGKNLMEATQDVGNGVQYSVPMFAATATGTAASFLIVAVQLTPFASAICPLCTPVFVAVSIVAGVAQIGIRIHGTRMEIREIEKNLTLMWEEKRDLYIDSIFGAGNELKDFKAQAILASANIELANNFIKQGNRHKMTEIYFPSAELTNRGVSPVDKQIIGDEFDTFFYPRWTQVLEDQLNGIVCLPSSPLDASPELETSSFRQFVRQRECEGTIGIKLTPNKSINAGKVTPCLAGYFLMDGNDRAVANNGCPARFHANSGAKYLVGSSRNDVVYMASNNINLTFDGGDGNDTVKPGYVKELDTPDEHGFGKSRIRTVGVESVTGFGYTSDTLQSDCNIRDVDLGGGSSSTDPDILEALCRSNITLNITVQPFLLVKLRTFGQFTYKLNLLDFSPGETEMVNTTVECYDSHKSLHQISVEQTALLVHVYYLTDKDTCTVQIYLQHALAHQINFQRCQTPTKQCPFVTINQQGLRDVYYGM